MDDVKQVKQGLTVDSTFVMSMEDMGKTYTELLAAWTFCDVSDRRKQTDSANDSGIIA